MTPLPYEIIEGMIQCFGRCFHYKDRMASFLNHCEVPRQLIDKHRQEYKFTWARKLLTELGDTENGRLVQRRILTALCMLRNLPDEKVSDPDEGLKVLRNLKELAAQHDLVARDEIGKENTKIHLAEKQIRIVQERAAKLETLKKGFSAAVLSSNRQSAGYSLEDILQDLFALFEIDYRKSFRTATQQIDGHFNFQGFDYLVEARWRQGQPAEQELGAFKHKIDSKLESTRGLFISVPGFRNAVVTQFNGRGANLILLDGQDLICILEGRIDLHDALKTKIEKAAQQGIVFSPLYVL